MLSRWPTYRKKVRQTDRQTDRQTGRQTDRQTQGTGHMPQLTKREKASIVG